LAGRLARGYNKRHMNIQEFIAYWTHHASDPTATERASAQSHFRDLCDALSVDPPRGAYYTFEKAVKKLASDRKGFADVWKRNHFGWEYKRKGADLRKAYEQLSLYRDDLENPPLLVVCDLIKFEIYTNFTGTNPKQYSFKIEDLTRPEIQILLKALFTDPDKLNPKYQSEKVTQEASTSIGKVAQSLQTRGHDSQQIAHFMMQLVFAFFAEDTELLPKKLVSRILEKTAQRPERAQTYLSELFSAMSTGGEVLLEDVPFFNGGLFEGSEALPLEPSDIALLLSSAKLDWAEVEPAIFGTLFERSLDPSKRAQLGAHYTSREDILRIVNPVILEPLREEWKLVRESIQSYLENPKKGKTAQVKNVSKPINSFLEKLHTLRVLDPACGSGNFLYVAMQGLLDLQRDVLNFAVEIGEPPLRQFVSPEQFYGLELNPFAQELASIVVWIGYLQWKRANGETNQDTPILRKLNTIQLHDALLNPDGTETKWPEAEYIVGNPPFLGNYKMRQELSDEYVERLYRLYKERVPNKADLVCYWFEKARAQIEEGQTKRAGLIATNSIRGGANRKVLERIKDTGDIFMAWSDESWILDGAAVRVSMLGFDDKHQTNRLLDGKTVSTINPDLTSATNVTIAKRLTQNQGMCFEGIKPAGAFTIAGNLAKSWLELPNPGTNKNSEVLKPYMNGIDITRKPSNTWLIDFNQMSENQASEYIIPFQHVIENVKPERESNRDERSKKLWWQHQRTRSEMREAINNLPRFICTPRVSKHRIFVWLPKGTLPDSATNAIARDDNFTFGVLQSKLHEVWALRQGTSLGVGNDPRYTPSTCFETFPFPNPSETQKTEIEKWAKYLDDVRRGLLAADSKATLTGIYNKLVELRKSRDTASPVYPLLIAHEKLDAAVAAAYGWAWPLSEEQILERLLGLNLERAT
jgi:type II restriction/modification system DNA methylase subunit YeeA